MNSYRPSLWSNIPPVVKNLLLINLILWLATALLPGILQRSGTNFDLINILGMHYWASSKFNAAQLITYMFMHGGFGHMFFNMFAVFMFGSLLERTWGSKRFLFYYMVTGIGAGIIQQIVWAIEFQPLVNAINEAISAGSAESLLAYEGQLSRYFRITNLAAFDVSSLIQMKYMLIDRLITVGASGAVFGILLAYGMIFPNSEIFIMFIPIPVKAKYFVIGYGVLELYLGFANRMGDNVAHFAHLGGMLFGIILILYWKKKGKLYS